MKQVFVISFIIALVIPFSGTFVWLKHQKKMVRKEVKRMMIKGLNGDELITFTFSEEQVENDLEWEHSKEFKYKGNMYDIVTSQVIEGMYVYTCWLDKKETKLNTQLAHLFGQKWNTEKGKYQDKTHLDHFVDSLFYDEILMKSNWMSTINKLSSRHEYSLLDLKKNQFSPPPELLFS